MLNVRQISAYLIDMFEVNSDVHVYSARHADNYHNSFPRTNVFQNTNRKTGPVLWITIDYGPLLSTILGYYWFSGSTCYCFHVYRVISCISFDKFSLCKWLKWGFQFISLWLRGSLGPLFVWFWWYCLVSIICFVAHYSCLWQQCLWFWMNRTNKLPVCNYNYMVVNVL